jgi:hypothetical protein
VSEIRELVIKVNVDEPAGLVEMSLDDFNRLEQYVYQLAESIETAEERVIHRLKMEMVHASEAHRDIWIGLTGHMFIARRLTRTTQTEYTTTGRAEVDLSPFDAIRKLMKGSEE